MVQCVSSVNSCFNRKVLIPWSYTNGDPCEQRWSRSSIHWAGDERLESPWELYFVVIGLSKPITKTTLDPTLKEIADLRPDAFMGRSPSTPI